MLNDIIMKYKQLCILEDHKRLYYYNLIQVELLNDSQLSQLAWIQQYAAAFREAVNRCDNEIELKYMLYGK